MRIWFRYTEKWNTEYRSRDSPKQIISKKRLSNKALLYNQNHTTDKQLPNRFSSNFQSFRFPFSFAAMKKLLTVLMFIFFLWGCSGNDSKSAFEKPEGDVDAARSFIRAALDGNYKQARTLILPDSSNVQLLDNLERAYLHNNNAMEQRGYRESSIRIHNTRKISDSASVVIYSNSLKNKQDSIKAVRVNNDWLVDLKYSFLQTRKAE